MNLAVIQTAGKQYLVKEGDTLTLTGDGKDASVLLLIEESKVKVGAPTVDGSSVKLEVVKEMKGPKIRVAKFKAKARYRRVTGFRSKLTLVKVAKIGATK